MADQYGSDFITITDEDGVEYELEVLTSLEYNGSTYLALMPTAEDLNPEVMIFRSSEEDGEPVLYTVEDAQELEAVNTLFMDSLFDEER
ncbi:MAG: DUF1292 domain-containing protein [Ruminococcaceae bacterium]|nr:DUF1292 domain-containing protein [Oscillospiraceae bacterium]